MILPPFYPEISIIDFFILSSIEIVYLWFLLKQYSIRELFPSIISINLIRIGVIKLIIPYILPPYDILYYDYSSYPFVMFAIIFLSGVIFSTVIYEKEQWALTRETASSLAFKVCAISTLVWLPLRQNTFFWSCRNPLVIQEIDTGFAFFSSQWPQNLISSDLLLVGGLIFALIILYTRLSRKESWNHPKNTK